MIVENDSLQSQDVMQNALRKPSLKGKRESLNGGNNVGSFTWINDS